MPHHNRVRQPQRRPLTQFIVVGALLVFMSICVLGTSQHTIATAAPSTRTTTNPIFGIDLPVGATLDQLPPGIRDYIHKNWPRLWGPPPATNPLLGIDLPAGAQPSDLPPGVTDYLRMPERMR